MWSAGKGCEMTFEARSWWLGAGEALRDERAKATLVLQGSTAVRWSDEVALPWRPEVLLVHLSEAMVEIWC